MRADPVYPGLAAKRQTLPARLRRIKQRRARNGLAHAAFIHRLDEIRNRRFELLPYRASGLNLVPAANFLWNTVYLERATTALRGAGRLNHETMLQFLAPLGSGHSNLTGDYV